MGPCLDAVGELTVAEQRVGKGFKRLAKHRKSHCPFAVGCLRLSKLTPRFKVCLRLSLGHE